MCAGVYISWSKCTNLETGSTTEHCKVKQKKMERTFTLGIVILIALTAFAQVSPINRENDSNVMRRNSLLEKLGMELCR